MPLQGFVGKTQQQRQTLRAGLSKMPGGWVSQPLTIPSTVAALAATSLPMLSARHRIRTTQQPYALVTLCHSNPYVLSIPEWSQPTV